MEIITGRTGSPHIYAADDAELYQLFLGDGDFCLNTGNKFEATMYGTNAVRVSDGSLIMQGRLAKIRPTDGYDQLSLDIGTVGYKRVDLIVAEYSQTVIDREVEQGGEVVTVTDRLEKIELKVVKGTPSQSQYIVPSIITGNIDNGETHQMLLWEVRLDGINFDSLVDHRVFISNGNPIQTALQYATQSVAIIQAMMTSLTSQVESYSTDLLDDIETFESNLNTSIYAYADTLREGISQGFRGRWRQTVTVSDSSSAITVTMAQDYVYSSADAIEVYLEGLRLVSTEYAVTGEDNVLSVTLNSGTFTGQMEVVIYRISEEA